MTAAPWAVRPRALFLAAFLLAALGLGQACASSTDGAPVSWVGCYRFTDTPPLEQMRLPWGFEVTDEPLADRSSVEMRVAVTWDTPTRSSSFPFSYWRELPADSIEMGTLGLGAVTMRLGLVSGTDDVSGWARDVGDAVPPGSSSAEADLAVTAEPTRCPASADR